MYWLFGSVVVRHCCCWEIISHIIDCCHVVEKKLGLDHISKFVVILSHGYITFAESILLHTHPFPLV